MSAHEKCPDVWRYTPLVPVMYPGEKQYILVEPSGLHNVQELGVNP